MAAASGDAGAAVGDAAAADAAPSTPSDVRVEMYREQWKEEQRALKRRMVTEDAFEWSVDGDTHPLRYVGGVDISFVKGNDVDACSSLVVLAFPSMEVVYEDHEMIRLELPYFAGYLGFREVPYMVDQLYHLRDTQPDLVPQVILVDGNGLLHFRQFGSASHLGVVADVPTIGVAKKLLAVEGLDERSVRSQVSRKCKKAGDVVELRGPRSGRLYGYALKSTDDTTRPVYVSPGHRISHETAVEVVRRCCLSKIPEPIRQADLRSRRHLRDHPPQ